MKNNSDNLDMFFIELDRKHFMEFGKELAAIDSALPIGCGQTISQPSLVLEMTRLLELEDNHKTLEIGTGSGYQTAFLARFSGHVYTVERIEELYNKAVSRLSQMGYDNISFKLGDGSYGWEEHAPYDRIMVTASATKIPDELLAQLAIDGKMVIPVGPPHVQVLYLVTKDSEGVCQFKQIEMVRFVRLIGDFE